MRPWTNIVGLTHFGFWSDTGEKRPPAFLPLLFLVVAVRLAVSKICSQHHQLVEKQKQYHRVALMPLAPSSMFWLSIILRQFVTVRANPLASSFICFILSVPLIIAAITTTIPAYVCEAAPFSETPSQRRKSTLTGLILIFFSSALYLPFSDSRALVCARTLVRLVPNCIRHSVVALYNCQVHHFTATLTYSRQHIYIFNCLLMTTPIMAFLIVLFSLYFSLGVFIFSHLRWRNRFNSAFTLNESIESKGRQGMIWRGSICKRIVKCKFKCSQCEES